MNDPSKRLGEADLGDLFFVKGMMLSVAVGEKTRKTKAPQRA